MSFVISWDADEPICLIYLHLVVTTSLCMHLFNIIEQITHGTDKCYTSCMIMSIYCVLQRGTKTTDRSSTDDLVQYSGKNRWQHDMDLAIGTPLVCRTDKPLERKVNGSKERIPTGEFVNVVGFEGDERHIDPLSDSYILAFRSDSSKTFTLKFRDGFFNHSPAVAW